MAHWNPLHMEALLSLAARVSFVKTRTRWTYWGTVTSPTTGHRFAAMTPLHQASLAIGSAAAAAEWQVALAHDLLVYDLKTRAPSFKTARDFR